MPTMTPGLFWSRFNEKDEIGRDITEYECTIFYYSTDSNGKKRVGEARTNRRTTVTVYSQLEGELADMIVYWYTVRPIQELYAELVSSVSTAYTLCQSAVDKGCKLSSLLDARDHLSSVMQTLKVGKSSKV